MNIIHNFLPISILILVMMILTGCATSPRTHFTNLQNDFFDISRVNVAGGPIGFGANIKVTKLLELQYDDYDAYRLGWAGRGVGVWHESSSGGTVSTHKFPLPYEDKHNFNASFKFGGSNLLESIVNTERGRMSGDSFIQPADEFRLAVYLGYVGADIGLRPLEAVDFICSLLSLGWLDILEDDQKQVMSLESDTTEAIEEVLKEMFTDEEMVENEEAIQKTLKEVVNKDKTYNNLDELKDALKEALKEINNLKNKK